MNAFASAREPVTREKTATLGEEIAQTYPPANAFERMLISQIEQSWNRLQQAQKIENLYFEGRDIVETITTKLAEFKAITRHVTDCERAWRHAVLHLEKTQRLRQRQAPPAANVTHQAPRKTPHPTPNPLPTPASSPLARPVQPHRE